MDPRIQANRARWDELAPLHQRSEFYDVDAVLAGSCTLRSPELELAGPVGGRRLLHLQCHFGLDSISWARRGARVTGVDFSPTAVDTARTLAERAGVEIAFHCTDVLGLDRDPDAAELAGAHDLVVSTWGTTGWLPDLGRWAEVVRWALAPGGALVLVEFHPQAQALELAGGGLLRPAHRYSCAGGEPDLEDAPSSYAAPDAELENSRHYWWPHGVGDTLTALLGAGFGVEVVQELDYTCYPVFAFTEEVAPGIHRHRGMPAAFPLTLAVRARRPVAG